MPGRGTRDHLINIRQLIEKLYEYNAPAILCFQDYTKAFDTIKWSLLWHIIEKIGVPTHLYNSNINIYVKNLAYVRVESELSESFCVEQGVRQGCIL